MNASIDGLTARLDVIAWIFDEATTSPGDRPLWLEVFKALEDDELHLTLMATVVTAAELAQGRTRQPGAAGTALLIAMSDRYGAELEQLQANPDQAGAEQRHVGPRYWTTEDGWGEPTIWRADTPDHTPHRVARRSDIHDRAAWAALTRWATAENGATS